MWQAAASRNADSSFGRRIVLPIMALVLAGALNMSFGFAQVQDGSRTQTPASAQGQDKTTKTIVSGGSDMGTYIEAVQANFGKPNVTVTLPTMGSNKN